MREAGFFSTKRWREAFLFTILSFSPLLLFPQSTFHIGIEEAYQKARENYPLIRQRDLISKTAEYTLANAEKGYLPTLSFSGQATYQSTVTSFPFNIPQQGFQTPSYSKDQYRVLGEADQLVYDGGIIANQKRIAKATEQAQQQSLNVQLYALYDRVNQLFFSALLIDEQLIQNALLKKDVQNGIDKAKAQVANGVALKSSVDELSAQLLQADQQAIEFMAMRKAYAGMLGLFLNQSITESTVLETPSSVPVDHAIRRPELLFYEAQKRTNDLQRELLSAQLRPRLSLYFQGGYGRPGLNMLSNNFAWYYIGGLRAAWNLGTLYTLKNQKQLIGINNESIEVQKETFLFNTSLQLKQQDEDLKKYAALLRNDDNIIALRQNVKQRSAAQFEAGVLSAHDYLSQVIAEDEARQNRILHKVQYLQAQYSYRSIAGQITPK